jgi:prevent-host-death family protein
MGLYPPEDIQSVTKVKADLAASLEACRTKRRPTFITQNGRATGVLMSLEEWEARERTLELFRRVAVGEERLREEGGASLDDVEERIRAQYGW